MGFQFAAAILVFVFAGVWLDRRFHSAPWFLLISVFVGAGAGFFSMYRKVTAAQRAPGQATRTSSHPADRRESGHGDKPTEQQ
jgi:F0F1-type ATP synthase assembly protein I